MRTSNSSLKSSELEVEIRRLQDEKHEALVAEERERCMAIFGALPKDLESYSEDAFGSVARVYVLRAYGHKDRGYKPDHEWIRLWHEYAPSVSVDDLWEIALGYIEGGCGISG